MKLNKIIFAVIASLFAVSFAAEKKSIVCATYPEYDWVMNILGEKGSDFEVTLLQKKGVDLHSYQPSFSDVAKISGADLFVFVGGESDSWAKKAALNAKNKNQIVVNMMESLGDKVREEEVVEGMQAEDEHHHEEDEHHHAEGELHDEEEEEPEYDEHVWLSLKNAVQLIKILSQSIETLDAKNASCYQKNASDYSAKLLSLDEEYAKAVESAKYKVLLFGDRFPFRYLVDDYNIKYYAAFVGCSAESEASFETVVFLSKKMDELDLPAVLTIEKGNRRLAQTIIKNTKKKNQKILEMDSLQSVTQKDLISGRNYYSAMKKNLEVLKSALN